MKQQTQALINNYRNLEEDLTFILKLLKMKESNHNVVVTLEMKVLRES
jgi:hypothetical protein